MITFIVLILLIILSLILVNNLSGLFGNPMVVLNIMKNPIEEPDTFNGIPSYYNAWDSNNKTIINLNRLITLNHNLILEEVLNIYKSYDASDEKIDHILLKYMGKLSNTSEKIPTLRNIISLFPDITLVKISFFYPGSILPEFSADNKNTKKYHYGLLIPNNDIGLKIKGYNVNWIEREGFIWDDKLVHSTWNNTLKTRIVIFADYLHKQHQKPL
jgi:aspartyl/asparaginyl beta-hydroxylase (cupin superfamily)